MTTRRKIKEYWTEVKRVVQDQNNEPTVKVTTCCCKGPGATRRECSVASGHKTPCRCNCHAKS